MRINIVVTFRLGNIAMTPQIRAMLKRAREANVEFHRRMWNRVYRIEGDTPARLCRSVVHADEAEATQLPSLELKADLRHYVLESIRFTGNKTLTNAAALRALFPVKDGEPLDLRKVSEGLQQLKKAYGSEGFVAFKDTVHADVDDLHHRVTLRIKCDEGRQFYVDHINMAGLDEETFQKVRTTLFVKPGDLYNQGLANLWLEQHSRLTGPNSSIRDRLKLDINERLGTVAMTYDFTPCAD